jgi:hypothetical protein
VCFDLVRQAQYHIDFRGGDLHESHVVHTIYPERAEDSELDAQAKAMALACGLQYNLVASPTDPHSQGGSGDGALMGEAMKAGVCSIVSECGLGYLTQPREEFVENHVVATINAMQHVGACVCDLAVPAAKTVSDEHADATDFCMRSGMMDGNPTYQHEQLGPQRYLDNPFVKVTS